MIDPLDTSQNLALDSKGMDALRQSAKLNTPESIKGAAKQFEALFMNMVMKSMRDATPQDSPFDNQQSRMYTSMLDQQVSQNLASRGVGLADVLIRQLSKGMTPVDPAQPGVTTTPKDRAGAIEQFRNQLAAPAFSPALADPVFKRPAADSVLSPARTESLTAPSRGEKVHSQRPHVRAFEERLGAHAEEASRVTGIPAKFMLGQAALESGWGRKEIVAADGSASHNVFGIKATGGWKGRVVEAPTTEYINGVAHKRMEKFRAYDSYTEAFNDYARMLRSNPRYENVLANAQDVSGFAQGLQRAGYATDPKYAAKLTQIINHSLSA